MNVTIIIVHYKADEEFFDCLRSIIKSKTKLKIEIIVVDNDETPTISKQLKKDFPGVKYIKSKSNVGFGAGNNLGNKNAKGKYLFFLNPDTIIFPDTVDRLFDFITTKPNIGIVAPLLLHQNKKPFDLQGASELTPLRAIVALSFINKLLPNNPISKKYFNSGWDKKTLKQVDVIPGTAFMISKKLFKKIGGFDENFFLYFEEFDLCKRVKNLGYKIFITPDSRIIHLWGFSTKGIKNIDIIFMQSRMHYFIKHYGFLSMVIVELFCRSRKKSVMTAFEHARQVLS